MCKEIERKFLWNKDFDIWNVVAIYPRQVIMDHYFNKTTRLRVIDYLNGDKKQLITVKSIDTLERDEYEYEIKPIMDLPKPMLKKTRFCIPYKDHVFEVNIYDSYLCCPEYKNRLYLIEVELENKDEELELPPWVGKEVTDSPYFYNYNIFNYLRNDISV